MYHFPGERTDTPICHISRVLERHEGGRAPGWTSPSVNSSGAAGMCIEGVTSRQTFVRNDANDATGGCAPGVPGWDSLAKTRGPGGKGHASLPPETDGCQRTRFCRLAPRAAPGCSSAKSRAQTGSRRYPRRRGQRPCADVLRAVGALRSAMACRHLASSLIRIAVPDRMSRCRSPDRGRSNVATPALPAMGAARAWKARSNCHQCPPGLMHASPSVRSAVPTCRDAPCKLMQTTGFDPDTALASSWI